MAVTVEVLYDQPQQELASKLCSFLEQCISAWIVTGFATVEGLKSIADPMERYPAKIAQIVVGAGTYRAYEALDDIVNLGVPITRLYVHLGWTRRTGPNARHRFFRYHPMLHSKVYLFDMGRGRSAAFVGSHNLTGFALQGLNGEAGTLIEGDSSEKAFVDLRAHVKAAAAAAAPYDTSMKEAYSWWTLQFIEGLRDKSNDLPRDGENERTIVVMAAMAKGKLPEKDDIIYFEIPRDLGQIQALQAEVHIYLFSTLPNSPVEGLARLSDARASLWCRAEGLEVRRGGVELRADWYIDDRRNPELKPTPRVFRPAPTSDMQQVRVRVFNEVFHDFEYLFQIARKVWQPVLGEGGLSAPGYGSEKLANLKLIPREDLPWFRVVGLEGAEGNQTEEYKTALRETVPQSGSYILFSLRRRKRP